MCNSSVHCLKVVVGGQRSLFENQWAEPIKRSLYLKGSFPKAFHLSLQKFMCERCQQGKDELSQVCEIYFGAVLKNPKENVTLGFKHFVLEISEIFSNEKLLVCLIYYFVIENFPDCFPCTSHHLPLGARQGNLR